MQCVVYEVWFARLLMIYIQLNICIFSFLVLHIWNPGLAIGFFYM